MEIIGLIAEYSPFHNGHLYQIKEIKKRYPDSLIILILNGYFLERGLISIESKEEKCCLALKYGIDLVIELPFVFGSNSADIFAEASLELLNEFKINRLIFGSECDDINYLGKVAKYQLSSSFDDNVKKLMASGLNYPTSLNKANKYKVSEPNDLLAISYIKTILKNKYDIVYESIKRTNDFHDISKNESIISASNIRQKINEGYPINKYIPEGKINQINNELLYNLLIYKILTDNNLSEYLTVDEGIEYRLKKSLNCSNNIDELIKNTKTKRYTYNRIMRMFMHILIGYKKEDKELLKRNEYIRILGLNKKAQEYINSIKKDFSIPIFNKKMMSTKTYDYELRAASIYKLLTNDDVLIFEHSNKPKRY